MTDLWTKHRRPAGLINSRKICICHKPIKQTDKQKTHKKTSFNNKQVCEWGPKRHPIQSRGNYIYGRTKYYLTPSLPITQYDKLKNIPFSRLTSFSNGTPRAANRLGPIRASAFLSIHHRVPSPTILPPLTSLSTELPDPITLSLFYHDKAGWAIHSATVSKLIASSSKCQPGPRGGK